MTRITSQPGAYVVTELTAAGVRTFFVGKDKSCSCGTPHGKCRHVKAVAEYLKTGGEQAPAALPQRVTPTPSAAPNVPATCPICGAAVQIQSVTGRYPLWRCQNSSEHYWQWRGDKVKAFLTQDHPNKAGAFYQQDPAARDAFLASHRLSYAAGV